MKRNLLKILPFLLLGGVLGLAAAPAAFEAAVVKAETSDSVVFSNFADKGSSSGGSGSSISFSSGDVSLSTNGGYSTKGVLRVYSGKKLTITSKNYKIGQIDFAYNSDNKETKLGAKVENVNDFSWSYTMTAQARFDSITVTFASSDALVSSIAVDSDTAPKTLVAGNAISYSGLKINGTMDDSAVYNVADKCTFDPAEGTILSNVGPQTVTVTYSASNTPSTVSGADLTTSFTVSVTQGEKENVYTKVSSIADGDKIIIVNTADAKAASTITDNYLDTVAVTIDGNNAKFTDSAGVAIFDVIGNDNDTLSFKNSSNKYLAVTGSKDDSKVLTFSSDIDSKSSWVIDEASLKNCYNNSTYKKVYLQFNSSTHDFRMYDDSQTDVEFYKYSSGAEKILVQSTASVLEEASVTISSTAQGFAPSSYLWTVGDAETLQIVGDNNKESVTVKGLKPGSTNLTVKADDNADLTATCVVTVIAKKDAVIENGDYFISDFSGSHVLNQNLTDISEPDYSSTNAMWTITNNGIDGDTYTISNNSNYLFHSGEPSGSSLGLSTDSSHYWVAEKVSEGVYNLSDSNSGNQLSCNPGANNGTWWAYAKPVGDQNKIKLLKAGNFVDFDVTLPTTKQYFVGDTISKTNLKVIANFDNGGHSDVTKSVVWDTLTEGTKAYGKVTIGGVERIVEAEGLKIYKGDASTFVIDGLHDTYSIGERINKDNLTVGITYKLSGSEDIVKDSLAKDDYTITPEKIVEGTEKIRIALAKDPTVYYEQEIEVKESSYVAAAHISAGDKIILGTLGYNPYEITGGQELSYNGTKFGYETFDYMPRGEMPFEVGKEGNYYTLKDPTTGYYLKGDNSSLTFNQPDYKSVYAESDGHYEFNLNVDIAGSTRLVTVETSMTPDFSNPYVFTGSTYKGGNADYMTYVSDLDNNKIEFNYWSSSNDWVEPIDTKDVVFADWKYEGGAFYYALEISSTLPEECLFTMSYDEDYEEWVVSSKPHQDKQLYFNKDGKFGFYTKGSSYTPLMVFRDNDLPLETTPTSVSVSFTPIEGTDPQEYMNTVNVGEQFPWTSALVVTAKYSGGASKVIPVGGYTIKQMPDTSTIGPSTGIISYGENGHQIEKEFTIYVTGHVSSLTIKQSTYEVMVGDTANFSVLETIPSDEPLTWTTNNPDVASIEADPTDSSKATLTAHKSGKIVITVTTFDGTVSTHSRDISIRQRPTGVSLDKTSNTIKQGEQFTLIPTVEPIDDETVNRLVTWSTSDADVAEVTDKGVVIGKKVGEATITVETKGKAKGADEGFKATCVVTVTEAPIVHVTGITLDCTQKELDLKSSKTFTLTATVNPSDATIKTVRWSSNHENIATVDQNGKVTAKAKGQCVITATSLDDESIKATCAITVKDSGADVVKVTGVTLDKTSAKLNAIGDTVQLNATVNPGNANNKKVTWNSSAESVATVDYKGLVTAKGNGTSIITVTTEDGGYTATCTVTVGVDPSPVAVESVSLDRASLSLGINEGTKLIATVNPSNATNKNVTWSSSDSSVAAVDNNGYVRGITAGTATITVTTEDGGKTATCQVSVTSAPTPVSVESVSLDTSKLILDIGNEYTLTATVSPSNATNQAVNWVSSNNNVVTVDSNGKVTAVAAGEAVIVVTTSDGGRTATCHVVVNKSNQEDKSNDNTAAVVAGVGGGVAAVGIGCGAGIPLGIRAKKRKLHK